MDPQGDHTGTTGTTGTNGNDGNDGLARRSRERSERLAKVGTNGNDGIISLCRRSWLLPAHPPESGVRVRCGSRVTARLFTWDRVLEQLLARLRVLAAAQE